MLLPHPLSLVVIVVTLMMLLVGSIISYHAHKVANRRQSRSFRLFSYGFAVTTLGLLLGALSAVLVGLDAEGTLLVQGLFVASGLLLLLASLYDVPLPSLA